MVLDAFLGPILQGRDIVVLEERGGPYATPALECPAFSQLPWTLYQAGPKSPPPNKPVMLVASRELVLDVNNTVPQNEYISIK